MFQQGSDSSKIGDPLKWLSEDDLYASIRISPDPDLVDRINQLRDTVFVNEADARRQLSTLPYLLCARFNPMTYQKENFASIEYFCVDVELPSFASHDDYLAWRRELQRDDLVIMAFLSALGDRLQIIFQFRKRCCDRGIFQLFYREFTSDFFRRHKIDYVPIRSETDPCKPIYKTIDPDAFHRIGADLVIFDKYINSSCLEDLHERLQKTIQKSKKSKAKKEKPTQEPSANALNKIKSILKHKPMSQTAENKASLKGSLYLFDQNADRLKQILSDAGIILEDIQTIRGGRKVYISRGQDLVVVNVLFDDDGRSAVTFAPGSSVDREFRSTAKSFLQQFILSNN